MSRGLFRYDIRNCETKVIPGSYGFIAQLNEGRHLKKRPTEFSVDQVLQDFDENKFNFTKVGQEEVLFRFEHSNDQKSHFFPSSPAVASGACSPNVLAINASNWVYFMVSPSSFYTLFCYFSRFINYMPNGFRMFDDQVSPIEYGHVLLIPRLLDCLPKRIDQERFLLALHLAKEAANPFFRVGYNSLGAFATINHLHFQVSFTQSHSIDGMENGLHSS